MQYEIIGGAFPVVECRVAQGESMITERGSMVWMSPNMEMKTSGAGGLGRMFAGESIFQNIYTSVNGAGLIAFGSSFPGKIMPIDVTQRSWIFLSVAFRKKLGAGLFGGEGFIMQRLSGSGIAFVEIDGDLKEIVLAPGQKIIVDTGNVAGFEEGVDMDIQTVKGVKNVLFGGEGLFNTVLTGPGRVWLQTMPISAVAGAIRPFIPTGK